MIVRKATSEDSEALIALTQLTPMKGKISLRIDRKPDFFRLLTQRGNHIVLVGEDEDEKITASFSATKQSFMINHCAQPVYYLGDLKVHPDFAKSTIAYRLIKAMLEEVRKTGVDIFLCTAAEDNSSVFSFFKGRAGLPAFQAAGMFNVFQLLPKKCAPHANVTSVRGERLTVLYNKWFSRYSFHPDIDLEDCHNICFIENGKITAAVSLFDPSSLKQNVIIDYPPSIGIALGVLRAFKKIINLPSLPRKGEELRLLYVKYFGFEPGREQDLIHLFTAARNFAFKEKYHFLTIAIDEKDQLANNIIKPMSSFNFRSHLMVTSLEKDHAILDTISSNLSYEDYSLV